MNPRRVYTLTALLFLSLASLGASAQQSPRQPPVWSGPPTTWWRDARLQKELQLNADQAKRIEDLFQKALPHLRQKREELDMQETELSRLVESDAAEPVIAKQAEYVESFRASLNTSRTL